MKRFLLPLIAAIALPTIVNADIRKIPEALRQSFSKDTLILETKAGETIEIKKKSVEIINTKDKSDLIFATQIFYKKHYKEERASFKESSWNKGTKEYFIENSRNLEKKELQDNLWVINKHSPKSSALHVFSFSFIPIFTDLNGKKSVLQKEYVQCLNPNLPNVIKDMWNFLMSPNYLDSKYVDFVCEKYAKF